MDKIAHSLGGHNPYLIYIRWGLGKGYIVVRWSVLINWVRLSFMRYCSPGDLDACAMI